MMETPFVMLPDSEQVGRIVYLNLMQVETADFDPDRVTLVLEMSSGKTHTFEGKIAIQLLPLIADLGRMIDGSKAGPLFMGKVYRKIANLKTDT